LRLLEVELLIRHVLREILLRSDIYAAALHGIGIDIVNIISIYALHETIWRQAIQHCLTFSGVRDAHGKACGREIIFLLKNSGGLAGGQRNEHYTRTEYWTAPHFLPPSAVGC
jgi:DNA gyrase/topoisomerase IV subunit B